MAASWNNASQKLHWLMTYPVLWQARANDLAFMTRWEYKLVQMHLYDLVRQLAMRLSLRQQVIATAMTYLMRFYHKAALVETDPCIVVAACVYLACKVEESPQHIRSIAQEVQNCYASSLSNASNTHWHEGKLAGDPTRIAEVEFYLISEMQSRLIVHHAYRVLRQLSKDFKFRQADQDCAWSMINEFYATDAPLLYSPHLIAYTASYMTLVGNRQKIVVDSAGKKTPLAGSFDEDTILTAFKQHLVSMSNILSLPDLATCTQMLLTHYAIRLKVQNGVLPVDGPEVPATSEQINGRFILKRARAAALARLRQQSLPENLLNLQRPSSRQQQQQQAKR